MGVTKQPRYSPIAACNPPPSPIVHIQRSSRFFERIRPYVKLTGSPDQPKKVIVTSDQSLPTKIPRKKKFDNEFIKFEASEAESSSLDESTGSDNDPSVCSDSFERPANMSSVVLFRYKRGCGSLVVCSDESFQTCYGDRWRQFILISQCRNLRCCLCTPKFERRVREAITHLSTEVSAG